MDVVVDGRVEHAEACIGSPVGEKYKLEISTLFFGVRSITYANTSTSRQPNQNAICKVSVDDMICKYKRDA